MEVLCEQEVKALQPELRPCIEQEREVIATRNRLIHGYLGNDDDTLGSIIQDDVRSLLPLLKSLRQEYQE